MEHPFIADADGPRLAGVHPGNDEDLVFYLLLYLDQAVDVIEDGPFIVGRTRADDEQKAVVLSRQDIFDGFIRFRLTALASSSMGNCSISSCGSGSFRIYSICISIVFPPA